MFKILSSVKIKVLNSVIVCLLHWECRVLATGPPGKFWVYFIFDDVYSSVLFEFLPHAFLIKILKI